MATRNQDKEVYDIVDNNDIIIGQTTRVEANKNPKILHRSVAVLVFCNGKLLLQKRSLMKDTDPGKWTVSCSGHVNSGETYDQAAKRELDEELGIKLEKPLEFIIKAIIRYDTETEYTSFYRLDWCGRIKVNNEEIEQVRFYTYNKKFLAKTLPTLNPTENLKYILKTFE